MSDYTLLLERLRAGLIDPDAAVWKNSELDEALRQAMADMSRAGGTEYTLAGLDGALLTTLPVEYFAALVRGAAGYALLWRAVERLDAFNLQPNLSSEALAAAAAILARFETALTALTALRAAAMHTAADSPFPDGSNAAEPGWQLPEDLSAGGG